MATTNPPTGGNVQQHQLSPSPVEKLMYSYKPPRIFHDDNDDDDGSSEISDSGHFLAKGAFLITPSNELNLEKATAICEKMNYRGPYSVTKTATGILFKFANQEDYQATFRKGFHKVTNFRFYKKVKNFQLIPNPVAIGWRV